MPIIRLDQLQQFAAINVLSDPGALGGPTVIPNCVQISLNWLTPASTIAHVILTGRAAGVPAPTPTQAQAIFSALTTGAAFTAFNAVQTTGGAFQSVSIRSIHTANQGIVVSTGAQVNGASATQPLPVEVALCVTKRTGFVGRAFRGRSYLTNFTQDSLAAGNVVAAATVTAVQTWVTGWAAILAGQGYTHVLAQPARAAYTGSTGTVHPARAAAAIDILQMQVRDNHWDSQRRRGLK